MSIKDARSQAFTNTGFAIGDFGDFLPNGRTLRYVAAAMWPHAVDLQQDFVARPFPIEVPLQSSESRLKFSRGFNVSKWLDLLDCMGQRASQSPTSKAQKEAADAVLELLRTIDWRRGQGEEYHFELAQCSAYLMSLETCTKSKESD